jgi:hypothetical protein
MLKIHNVIIYIIRNLLSLNYIFWHGRCCKLLHLISVNNKSTLMNNSILNVK